MWRFAADRGTEKCTCCFPPWSCTQGQGKHAQCVLIRPVSDHDHSWRDCIRHFAEAICTTHTPTAIHLLKASEPGLRSFLSTLTKLHRTSPAIGLLNLLSFLLELHDFNNTGIRACKRPKEAFETNPQMALCLQQRWGKISRNWAPLFEHKNLSAVFNSSGLLPVFV